MLVSKIAEAPFPQGENVCGNVFEVIPVPPNAKGRVIFDGFGRGLIERDNAGFLLAALKDGNGFTALDGFEDGLHPIAEVKSGGVRCGLPV
jgi:hypothetical protein